VSYIIVLFSIMLFSTLLGIPKISIVTTISFVVNKVFQFMHKPTYLHLQVAKRILRYLKSTISYGVLLGWSPSSDTDWVDFPDDTITQAMTSTNEETQSLASINKARNQLPNGYHISRRKNKKNSPKSIPYSLSIF
jgi:hypothetical protein